MMKERIKALRQELLCLLWPVLLIPVVFLWVRYDGVKNVELGSILLLLALVDIVLFVRSFRRLWREKWRTSLARGLQTVFAKVMHRLSITLEKWGIGKKKGNFIGGRTKVLFDCLSSDTEGRRPTVRRVRWKNLPDSRARLGYLYSHMIKRRIEHGSAYYSSDTPAQLQKREPNEPIEDELFSLYIRDRYDERIEPDEDTLLRIKDEMQIK